MSTRYRFAFVAALVCCGGIAAGQEQNVLPNGGFADGLAGWVYRPGDASQVSVVTGGGDRDTVLQLQPDGRLLGVETTRLAIGRQLAPQQAYQVQADLMFEGLDSGVFAFSMYCFDAQGKSLKQIVFYSLSTNSSPHDWRRLRGTFGPGTQNPLPVGTQSICIRFSFYEAGGDCRGSVAVDDVLLLPYQPPEHEGWPSEIVADVGDLQVRFESRSFWTLYRIDYRGTRLCLDRWGSHYGSVVSLPGVGFIGSGHTEHEDEQILDLKLSVDGSPVEKPASTVQCRQLTLQKQSRIRNFVLHTVIQVQDNISWKRFDSLRTSRRPLT